MLIHLIIFLAAFVITLFLTPRIINFSKSIGALDYPAQRSIHKEAVPRLGGLAIVSAFSLNIVFFLIFKVFLQNVNWSAYWQQNKPVAGIIIGSIVIFFVGLIDDIYDVSPAFKFGGQIIAAIVAVSFGVVLEFISSPVSNEIINIPYPLGAAIAIFWMVALTNTINFIDGLDGLASGIAIISSGALYYGSILTGRADIALALAVLAGCLLGFLRFNFNPAKIFMGDSGSMFLGFFLGAVIIQSAAKSAATIALLVPIVIMGIPIFDAAYAIWRRFINRKPLTKADKEHIHHLLLHKGLSHRATVLLIYGWTLVLSVVGLSLRFVGGTGRIIILLLLLPVSFFLAYYSGLLDWLVRQNPEKSPLPNGERARVRGKK